MLTGGFSVTDEIFLFTRKWFRSFGEDNIQHLVAARFHTDINMLGLTTSRLGGTNFSIIFVQRLNDQVPKSAEWRFNGEVTTHELTHQWQVNASVPSGGGHCAERRYDASSLWCSMHGSYDDSNNCQDVCPEFVDGVVAFHYRASDADSEYLFIRRRAEPFPQF